MSTIYISNNYTACSSFGHIKMMIDLITLPSMMVASQTDDDDDDDYDCIVFGWAAKGEAVSKRVGLPKLPVSIYLERTGLTLPTGLMHLRSKLAAAAPTQPEHLPPIT